MGPNVWRPLQPVHSIKITVDNKNHASMKDRELKSYFGYRDYICDIHEKLATKEFRKQTGIKDEQEFKNTVKDYSRIRGEGYITLPE